MVDEHGALRKPQVVRPIDPWLDAEALRVVRMLHCFTPDKQNGKNVAVYVVLPIKFSLGK